jgi:hypothetical protein
MVEGVSREMSGFSLEGVDTCEPDLGHGRTSSWETEAQANKAASLAPRPASAGPLPLSFTSDALVQGFVMSEILARPGQRKWGNH